RQALPGAAPDRAQRADALADRLLRRRAAHDHHRVHARGRRALARARDRVGVPQGRPPGRRGHRPAAGERVGRARARAAGQAALPRRGQATDARAGRRDRAGVDAGGWRRAVRRGDGHRPGPADRRPEGEGARRAARRDPHSDRARRERGRRRRDPRAPAPAAAVPLRPRRRRGPRGRARAAAAGTPGGRVAPPRGYGPARTATDPREVRMAKSKAKAAKAGSTAAVATVSPYLQRLIQDAELRNNLKTAYDSARVAYGRINNGKAPAKLLDDRKLQ